MRFLNSRTLRYFRERIRELAGRDAPEQGAPSGDGGDGRRAYEAHRGGRSWEAHPVTSAAAREEVGNVWKMEAGRRRACGPVGPGMADAEGRA